MFEDFAVKTRRCLDLGDDILLWGKTKHLSAEQRARLACGFLCFLA